MATTNAHPDQIIRVGSLFFFTTPLPAGIVDGLRRNTSSDVNTSILALGRNIDSFVLVVTWHPSKFPVQDGDQEQAVRTAVEYTWGELFRRGVVDSETMPEWIVGDPSRMIPEPTNDVFVDQQGQVQFGSQVLGQIHERTFT